MFVPLHGAALAGAILGALAFGAFLLFLVSLTPTRARKPLIAGITFLAGMFYTVEYFYPVALSGPHAGENFLTPFLKPVSAGTNILEACALGLGVYSLVSLHLRNVLRKREGSGFSALLLISIVAMTAPCLLFSYHPNRYNKSIHELVFTGAYNGLNSTMFSIVAFYIVSAAYRAFRIRSVESTILLVSAFIVMLGQVAVGQAITSGLPNTGFIANFRLENAATWILTRVNSPANLAVDFGIGIGGLATSLRLWLSLERGSYFDQDL